jgi:integrase
MDKVTTDRLAQANGRLKAGNVGLTLIARNNRIYLRGTLPPKPGSLKTSPHQQEIALGIRANPAGVSTAEREARRVGALVETREFRWEDFIKKPDAKQMEALLKLWDKYVEFKKPTVAVTTLMSTYAKTRSKLVKWDRPIPDKLTAYQFRDWLLQGCQPVTARKYLLCLNACFIWAMDCNLTDANPFASVMQGLKVNATYHPDPFSQEEVRAILETFKTHRYYSYYYPYVKFLFLTGCRPEDAVGLCWKHVNLDEGVIEFREAVNTQFQIRKVSKTGKPRLFPIGSDLGDLLVRIKAERVLPDDPVFTSRNGQMVRHGNFTRRAWNGYTSPDGKLALGIVKQLIEDGKIDHYREPYACRDTFISHCLEQGINPVQVAAWVGNSPEIIHRHYAGVVKSVEVPALGF